MNTDSNKAAEEKQFIERLENEFNEHLGPSQYKTKTSNPVLFEFIWFRDKMLLAYRKSESDRKEIERLKIKLSNYAYQIDCAKDDRNKAERESEWLKSELERVKEQNVPDPLGEKELEEIAEKYAQDVCGVNEGKPYKVQLTAKTIFDSAKQDFKAGYSYRQTTEK